GESLVEKNGRLECRYCGATYDLMDEAASFEQMLEGRKQEALANRRRILWDEVHKKNPSERAIVNAAESVREINSEDPLARFYLAAHEKDPTHINGFLSEETVNDSLAKEVVRFMLLSLEPIHILALKSFVDRHFKGEDYTRIMSRVEAEADEVEEGTYMTSLPRDVFLAYSSKDMEKVIEITTFLEDNDFTVFCALRNLRHGKGAVENYDAALKDAMAHCKAFVFLSSENSRTLKCDALKIEIPYLLDNLPKVNRIHFRLDDEPTKAAAAIILKNFDDGREWCRTKDDLVERLLSFDRKPVQPEPTPAMPIRNGGPEVDPDDYTIIDKRNPDVVFTGDTLLDYHGSAKRIKLCDDFYAVERGAFKNAPRLEEIHTGDGVRKLSPFSIDGAEYLKKFVVGSALQEIGSGAFARVPNLEKIEVEQQNLEFAADNNGGLETLDGRVFYRYPPKQMGKTYKMSLTADEIDVGAFAGCEYLEEVILPDGLETIGNGAFAKCPILKKVFVPKSVMTMGKNVFAGCPSLVIRVEADSFPFTWNHSFAGGTLVSYGSKRNG
ncbi:MAG: leucine-rich repeat protein, partial [Bacilli bacterium]|nr:leucine-rich repeat protein [Bacilli bacterium]